MIMADDEQKLQEVPVDWEALEDAFENNAPEVHSYLQIKTGEVLRVVDGVADPEMHSRISTDGNYMRIEPVSSREQYRWMERFIPMVEDELVQERLTAAIDGKGAFRRFKDVLMTFATERERWFAFRSERLRVFMEAWLGAHGLVSVAPMIALRAAEEGEREDDGVALVHDQVGTRTGKGGDNLRQHLMEITEGMPGRDFEKVIAFAEFLKARRAARSYAVRSDVAASPAPPAAQVELPRVGISVVRAVEKG
jgi:hypothetical protein